MFVGSQKYTYVDRNKIRRERVLISRQGREGEECAEVNGKILK